MTLPGAEAPSFVERWPVVPEDSLVDYGRFLPAWRCRLARVCFSAAARLTFYRALAVYQGQDIRESVALVNWWNVITARGSKGLWHPLAVLIPVLLYGMHYQGIRWQTLFKTWIPATDAMILTASERIGLTPPLLQSLIVLAQAQRLWRKRFAAALLPAMVNLVWLLVLLAGIALVYFPALQRSMPHLRLIGRVGTLAQFSDAVVRYGPGLLLLLIAAPFLMHQLLRRLTGSWRLRLDLLPGFALYRQATGMTFLLGVAALLQVGETFRDAAMLLRQSATPYVRERLDAILAFDDLRPAEAMAASGYRWPDDATIELLLLYMTTRAPQDGIRTIVDDWFEQAGDRVARLAVLVSSLGQILTWSLVGWLYLVTSDLASTVPR